MSAAPAGSELARRFAGGFAGASGARRAVVLLLTMTAAIHAGIVPGHLDENPVLATLFALDFVALTVAAVLAFYPRVPAWRAGVAALLVANFVAYAAYVAAGVETVDVVGLASKAIEIAALILVIHPATTFVGIGERGTRRLEIIPERRIVQ